MKTEVEMGRGDGKGKKVSDSEYIKVDKLCLPRNCELEDIKENHEPFTRTDTLPTFNFLDKRTINSIYTFQRLIYYTNQHKTRLLMWCYSGFILGIIVATCNCIIQYTAYEYVIDYNNKIFLPYILCIFVPFYILPLFMVIMIYLFKCAALNDSYVTVQNRLNNFR